MSFTRARALQSLQTGLRQARPALRQNTFKSAQLQAKRFASSGHGAAPSSDLPWLIGAIVVTVPSVYYLWPSPHSDDHHGSHDEHEEHAEAEPQEEEEPAEEKSEDDGSETKGAEEDSASKDSKDDLPAEGEAESEPAKGDGNIEGVNFKGKVKPDSDGAQHSVKVESDSKGEAKKRLDSGLQKNLGPGHEQEGSDRDFTTMDGKQKGLSNTQTRHSVPIHEDPEKSKKPDGTPDTSKQIGTVDPSKTR